MAMRRYQFNSLVRTMNNKIIKKKIPIRFPLCLVFTHIAFVNHCDEQLYNNILYILLQYRTSVDHPRSSNSAKTHYTRSYDTQ